MSDDSEGTIHSFSAGSIAASHPDRAPLRILAGPTTSGQFNTIQSAIFPIACFKLEDVRFDFDSSVLTPDTAREMPLLKKLIDAHTVSSSSAGEAAKRPRVSIFGHTDPEGSDDYNKILGGRRAAVLYGMLTRRTEVWEDLYSNTQKFASVNAGDKWGLRSIQIMLNAVLQAPSNAAASGGSGGADGTLVLPLTVDGQTGPQTRQAISQFQSQQGLGASGSADAATRKALFKAYMDLLCVDQDGKPWQLDPKDDFLGRNAHPQGKADFQGCGEFNPVMLFSQSDLQAYDAATDHTERDELNRVNRRVMTLLFRPGAVVNPTKWPCPAATGDTTGCRNRFWSDGDQRRANGPDQRVYSKTEHTFACRFYDRLISGSPCETIPRILSIRLLDAFSKPIPYAPYVVTLSSGGPKNGTADENGWLREALPKSSGALTCQVNWGYPKKSNTDANDQAAARLQQVLATLYNLEVTVDVDQTSPSTPAAASDGGGSPPSAQDTALTNRLANLGYDWTDDLSERIRAFQRDHRRPEGQTGNTSDVRDVVTDWHDTGETKPVPINQSITLYGWFPGIDLNAPSDAET
jgi:peptidoglycan hydrolase-like protein with peptidoglycan-binding domain